MDFSKFFPFAEGASWDNQYVHYNHMSHAQVELTLCAQKQKKIINSMAILLFLLTQS